VLISTHVVSGALLGRAVGRPLTALAVGLASHLALDALPHWGEGGGWPVEDMDDETFRVAVVDGLVGLALIAVVLRLVPPRRRLPVAAGIVGACLPDMDKPGRRFAGRSPWPERFDRLHAEIQVGAELPDRLVQDVAIAAVGAAVSLVLLREDEP
jgi:hypothetical protein